jgi:hypothetical protein
VTIDSPTDPATVTAATLPVAWTPSAQAQYRLVLHTAGTSDFHYDTGWVVDAVTNARTIPSGSYENGGEYDLLVGVKDGSSLEGWSSPVSLTVAYTPPATLLDTQAEAEKVDQFDPFETSIHGLWTASTEPGFTRYLIKRSADGGPDETEIDWLEITSASLAEFVDYTPASGYVYIYRIFQEIAVGDDLLLSDPAVVTASVTLLGVVLTDVADPLNNRAVVRRTGKGRKFKRTRDEAVFLPPATGIPRTIRRRGRYWEPSISFQLIAEDGQTARQHRLRLESLDENAGTLCYRDGEQRKLFVTMPGFEVDDELVEWFSGTIGLRQEGFTEGVEA